MANTRQIRRRIQASQNISKITKAMEMVSASKMKRSQDQALASRPYARELQKSLRTLSQRTDAALHPLLEQHEAGFDVLVIFSTEKGLCGAFNTTLAKQTLHWMDKHPKGKVITIGRKAINFSRLFGFEIHAQFTNLPERVTTSDILPISTLVIDGFLNHTFRKVDLLFMDFINTLSQKPQISQLLPLQANTDFEAQSQLLQLNTAEYIFEPSPREILAHLLPYYIENTIYQTMLESRASEHSARMVAMKNASENAKELVNELRLLYNKSRQASITTELLEIATAALTIK